MITDAQGHTLTGATAEAATHFEQAVTAFNLVGGSSARASASRQSRWSRGAGGRMMTSAVQSA